MAQNRIKKPHIEEVFKAFQDFQNESIRAGINVAKHKEAQSKLKEACDSFGFDIDWTEPT